MYCIDPNAVDDIVDRALVPLRLILVHSRDALEDFVSKGGTFLITSRITGDARASILRNCLMIIESYVRFGLTEALRRDPEWIKSYLMIQAATVMPEPLSEFVPFLPHALEIFPPAYCIFCKAAKEFLE